MIYSLDGTVIGAQDNELLFAVGPITLRIAVPVNLLGKIQAIGGLQKLFISLVWKETGPQLYGFTESGQIDLFEKLQTVSGIGPKLALSVMGHYESPVLANYLLSSDVAALNRIPGIGNKTAQRLVVELKDKAVNWAAQNHSLPAHSIAEDAMKALLNLGYPQAQAKRMIESVKGYENHDLSSLITLALQQSK